MPGPILSPNRTDSPSALVRTADRRVWAVTPGGNPTLSGMAHGVPLFVLVVAELAKMEEDGNTRLVGM